jgi:hypothetical protein
LGASVWGCLRNSAFSRPIWRISASRPACSRISHILWGLNAPKILIQPNWAEHASKPALRRLHQPPLNLTQAWCRALQTYHWECVDRFQAPGFQAWWAKSWNFGCQAYWVTNTHQWVCVDRFQAPGFQTWCAKSWNFGLHILMDMFIH